MATQYQFTRSLEHNSKSIRNAFLGMTILIIVCAIGITLSYVFWEGNTETVYSFRYQTNREIGWPVTVSGWGWWIGGGTLLLLPFVYFMQDFKNPSLALTSEGLFINQQAVRNTFVPFSNIKNIEQIGDPRSQHFRIHFNDNAQVYNQQKFIFKALLKKNLEMNPFSVEPKNSKGDINGLMAELQSRLSQ